MTLRRAFLRTFRFSLSVTIPLLVYIDLLIYFPVNSHTQHHILAKIFGLLRAIIREGLIMACNNPKLVACVWCGVWLFTGKYIHLIKSTTLMNLLKILLVYLSSVADTGGPLAAAVPGGSFSLHPDKKKNIYIYIIKILSYKTWQVKLWKLEKV